MTAPALPAGVAVVVNPQAGLTRADTKRLRRIIGNRGFVIEAGTADQLADFVRMVRRDAISLVCVCGGDGTLGKVATALVGELGRQGVPAIAPLGGGTMNTIARSLGLRRAPPAAVLESLVRGEQHVERLSRGTMEINRSRIGFMFGAGVPARFLRIYEEGTTLGRWRAAQVLGQLISSALIGGTVVRDLFAAVDGRVELDGDDIGLQRVSMVYAAVIDDIGLGFRPTPRANGRDGVFEVLAADARALDLVKALPRIRFGNSIGGSPWIDRCGSALSVRTQDPLVYMVDGDVEPPQRDFEVRAGPVLEMLIAAGSGGFAGGLDRA